MISLSVTGEVFVYSTIFMHFSSSIISLENDLNALKISHGRVVDTALLFCGNDNRKHCKLVIISSL